MKGQGVKRWAASFLSGLGVLFALIVFSGAAKAGSRFETTPMPSTKASTNLDFTIVIPEVIYLASAREGAGRDTPKRSAARGPDGVKPSESYIVLTNGGTLAFAPAGSALAQSAELGSRKGPPETPLVQVFLVAMP